MSFLKSKKYNKNDSNMYNSEKLECRQTAVAEHSASKASVGSDF